MILDISLAQDLDAAKKEIKDFKEKVGLSFFCKVRNLQRIVNW